MASDGGPRQKMIGMMYLVLTALLALNVSKQILNAFVVMETSMDKTKQGVVESINNSLNLFKGQAIDNPGKAKAKYDAAVSVHDETKNLIKYVKELRSYLIAYSEGIEKEIADTISLAYVGGKDNYDKPTEVLFGKRALVDEKAKEFTSLEFKNKIVSYKETLSSTVRENSSSELTDDYLRSLIGLDLPNVPDNEGKLAEWEHGNFYEIPLAAIVANLTKIESDIYNSENNIIKELYRQVDATDFKVTNFVAKVISDGNYVLQGDTFYAELLLVGQDRTLTPTINVFMDENENAIIPEIVDGRGVLRIPANKIGTHSFNGFIEILRPGTTEKEKYEIAPYTYTIAKPSLTVAATKMNVLYIGVDNPLSVSVPGYSEDQLIVSESGPINISNKKGKDYNYIAKAKKIGDAQVIVSVKDKNGNKVKMGSMEFRVKRVPDPDPFIAKKSGSFMLSKNELLAQAAIIAQIENFDFDLNFDVTSFDMTYVSDYVITSKAKGKYISEEMKEIIKKVRPKSRIFFENIKAKGADGSIRDLSPITITIK